MWQYTLSLFYGEDIDTVTVDEKSRRAKYLTCEILKKSKIKLKPLPKDVQKAKIIQNIHRKQKSRLIQPIVSVPVKNNMSHYT